MMVVYSIAERVCLIESYFSTRSYDDAKHALHILNPQAPVPHNSTLMRLVEKFRRTGSVADATRSGRPSNDDDVAAVQGALLTNPKSSLRRVSQQVSVPYTNVHRITRKTLGLFPYKIQVHQSLKEIDYESRSVFCTWLIATTDDDPTFLDTCFFSDEAWFHLSGYINTQNSRYWASKDPHQFIESTLHPQKVGVWAALSASRIFFCFFQDTVKSQTYCDFIDQFVMTLTEQEIEEGWFQHDGATAHTSNKTKAHVEQFFGPRTIAKSLFPPRSPDLTPPDFYLWGCLKDKVYANNPTTLDQLKNNITEAINSISKECLQKVSHNIVSRAHLCLSQSGGHFEHIM